MINDDSQSDTDRRRHIHARRERQPALGSGDAAREGVADALGASQAHLRLLVEQMPAVLWATDADLRITTSLGGGLAGLGLRPSELVGRSLTDYLGTTDPEYPPLTVHLRALRGESGSYTLNLKGRTFQSHLQPLTDPAGRICGTVGVALDITDRQRAEESLRESQRSLSTLLANLPGMAYRGRPEPDRTMEFVSDGCVGLTGYTAAELTDAAAAPYGRRIHPDDRAAAWKKLQAALRAGRPYRLRYRLRTACGGFKWMWESGRRVPTAGGGPALEGFITSIQGRKRAEEELQATQERFRAQYQGFPIPTYTWQKRGEDFCLIDFNEAARTLTRGKIAQLAGTRAAVLYAKQPDILSDIEACHQRQMTVRRQMRYRLQTTGEEKDFDVTYVFLPPDLVMVHTEDVTERLGAEAALRESNQTLQSLIGASPLAIIALDRAGRVVTWNRAAKDTFGWTDAEVLGRPLPFVPPDRDAEHRSFRDKELSGRPRRDSEVERVRKDGSRIFVSQWTAPVFDDAGAVKNTIGVVADITERKQAEAEVREKTERLQELSRRLLEVQEAERRHLARELHDEVGQALTGINLTLRLCARLPDSEGRAKLSQAERDVRELMARVRDLSLRLRPTMLDDLGLLPALLYHSERFSTQTQVRVALEHQGLGRRIYPREVETAAYRIVQEALTNVARHAGVRHAVVRARLDGATLRLEVEDRGTGFDPRAARAAGTSSGLSGMQERAVLLGGRFEIISSPGTGTRLIAELPVQAFEERRGHAFDLVTGG
jgi:PAS domain S-box-containing protein